MYLLAILTSTFVKCLFDPFALLIESSIDEEYDEKKNMMKSLYILDGNQLYAF